MIIDSDASDDRLKAHRRARCRATTEARKADAKRAAKRKPRRVTTAEQRAAAADRQALRRAREAQGISVIPMPFNLNRLAEILFAYGLIELRYAECPRALGEGAAQLLERYRKF
jgi:hypothetical protein